MNHWVCEWVKPVLRGNTSGSWVADLDVGYHWEPPCQTPGLKLHPLMNRARAPLGTPAPSSCLTVEGSG